MPVKLFWVWLLVVLVSCQGLLVDFAPLEIVTNPGENQVTAVPGTLEIRFSTPVDRASAENLVAVSSVDGGASGDFQWKGNTLVFTPVPALVPGKRHVLTLEGPVMAYDGRRFEVHRTVPFFVGSRTGPGRLTGWTPGPESDLPVSGSLVLSFDGPVDPGWFQTAFSVVPSCRMDLTWAPDARSVVVTPVDRWKNLTVYTWKLVNGGLTDRAVFRVGADQTPPKVVSVVPGVWETDRWLAAGPDLGPLAPDDGLLITLSEPVDPGSLDRSFRISPPIGGHFSMVNPTTYVYVPGRTFDPGVPYGLRFTGDLEDLSGNRMALPWSTVFIPREPLVKVKEVEFIGGESVLITDFRPSNSFPVCVPRDPDGQIEVRISFDRDLTAENRSLVTSRIHCRVLVPSDQLLPTLADAFWESPRTLVLTYRKLVPGLVAGRPPIYQFQVPMGTVLAEDLWINFSTGF